MDINTEKIVSDVSVVPQTLYHLVPADLYDTFIDKNGNYDCRNRVKWGKNSPFIHTTTDIKTLKEKIIGNFVKYIPGVDFLLLEIKMNDIVAKITYSDQNGTRYYHLWTFLPKGSYTTHIIKRRSDGGFVL